MRKPNRGAGIHAYISDFDRSKSWYWTRNLAREQRKRGWLDRWATAPTHNIILNRHMLYANGSQPISLAIIPNTPRLSNVMLRRNNRQVTPYPGDGVHTPVCNSYVSSQVFCRALIVIIFFGSLKRGAVIHVIVPGRTVFTIIFFAVFRYFSQKLTSSGKFRYY